MASPLISHTSLEDKSVAFDKISRDAVIEDSMEEITHMLNLTGSTGQEKAIVSAGMSLPSVFQAPFAVAQRPLLLVMLGSHTSGKSTLARHLHDVFNLPFDGELGDVLRVPDGGDDVLTGYRRSDMLPEEHNDIKGGWDAFIFRKERERDSVRCRHPVTVVESWHIQNYAWVAFRDGIDPTSNSNKMHSNRLRNYFSQSTNAVEFAINSLGFNVIAVNLCTRVETMLRRKFQCCDGGISKVTVEHAEAVRLHATLHQMSAFWLKGYNSACPESSRIPVLTLDNDIDGLTGQSQVVEGIMAFVRQHSPNA